MNKIIYYSTPHFEELIKQEYPQSYKPDFWHLTRLVGAPSFDRTNTLYTGFQYHIQDPIPSIEGESKENLHDLFDRRAKEIIAQAESKNKEVMVFWSGGIDSTIVLVSLLKNNSNNIVINVAMTEHSIQEHPTFFNNIIKDKLPTYHVINELTKEIVANNVVTSGEFGDQIFGGMLAKSLDQNRLLDTDYKDVMRNYLLDRTTMSDDDIDSTFEYWQPQIEKCPVPIETAVDLVWWSNFCFKWQFITNMFKTTTAKLSPPDVMHFFQTDYFQIWSMLSVEERRYSSWDRYKYQPKLYIYDFDNDADYLENKRKEVSLNSLNDTKINDSNYIAYLEDDSFIRYGVSSSNLKMYRPTFGSKYDYLFY